MSRPLRKIVEQTQALSAKDIALADELALFFVRECADLGDEREAVKAIFRKHPDELPRGPITDPIFDAALEKARALRQGRQI